MADEKKETVFDNMDTPQLAWYMHPQDTLGIIPAIVVHGYEDNSADLFVFRGLGEVKQRVPHAEPGDDGKIGIGTFTFHKEAKSKVLEPDGAAAGPYETSITNSTVKTPFKRPDDALTKLNQDFRPAAQPPQQPEAVPTAEQMNPQIAGNVPSDENNAKSQEVKDHFEPKQTEHETIDIGAPVEHKPSEENNFPAL